MPPHPHRALAPRPSSKDAAAQVLRFAAAFIWADAHVCDAERTFLRGLAEELGLDGHEETEALLGAPPPPDAVDPRSVPAALAAAVRDAALRAIAADGRVDEPEMDLWDLLDDLLPEAA